MQKKVTRTNKISGYSLAELAIVVAILSILFAGGISFIEKKNDAERYRITMERMDAIETAIMRYVDLNQKLPCPAPGTALETASTFGSSSGVYDYTTNHNCSNGTTTITNQVGMIPNRTLELADEFAYDGWERKFSYTIATGLGDSRDFMNILFRGDIRVQDYNGVELTEIDRPAPYNYGAAYVLISHSPGGIGAWHKNDTTTPTTTNAMVRELINLSHLTATPIRSYVADVPSKYFRNIVRYKQKNQLYRSFQALSPIRLSESTCNNAKILTDNVTSGGYAYSGNAIYGYTVSGQSAPDNTYGRLYYMAPAYAYTLCQNQPYNTSVSKPRVCQSSPFTLPSASNLKFWVDGSNRAFYNNHCNFTDASSAYSTIAANGYTTIPDISGSGNTATITWGATNLACVTLNSFANNRTSLVFGSQTYATMNFGYAVGSNFTIFVVDARKYDSASSNLLGWQNGTTNTRNYYTPYVAGSYHGRNVFSMGNGNQQAMPVNFQIGNAPSVMIHAFNGSNQYQYVRASDGTAFEYGTNVGMSQAALSGAAGTSYMATRWDNTALTYSGQFGEVLIYNSFLSYSDMRAIEGYLTRKWITGECANVN